MHAVPSIALRRGSILSLLSAASAALMAASPADMPANSWLEIPHSLLKAVTPDMAVYPKIRGNTGPASVVVAWSGAALDTKRSRLILWGGGHADYHGNELYAFDVPTLAWQRITDPFPDPVHDQQINADGTPNARHTYNGLAYIAHADRFFACGGALSGKGFALCDTTWTYDFAVKAWETHRPGDHAPGGGIGHCCAYDPVSKRVFFGNGKGLFAYTFDTDSWVQLTGDAFYYITLAVDPKRRLLVGVGNKSMISYDLTKGDVVRRALVTSGGDAFIAAGNPGFEYDPVADRMVGWVKGTVYVLDDETWTWKVNDVPGGPQDSPNGTYGRWRYVPAVNAFILVTAWDADVFFYKLTAAAGTGASR
jgi:hypothetical protein